MHAEVKYSKGKYKADDDPETQTYNQDGFGAYLDFVLGYPTGNATLGAWYFDGNGETQLEDGRFVTDDHRHSLVTPGEAFYPFVVFYRGHNVPTGTFGSWGGQETANHWAFALMGNHKLTPNITLNWGVADFRRARSTKLNDGTNVSKHLGTEVDLGLVFKFLEKVQFSSKIGVFNNGSYWKERYGDDNFSGTTWAWGNELIFNF
jgi:hypothetical protein